MHPVKFVISGLCTLLVAGSMTSAKGADDDQPNPYLRNVSLVRYFLSDNKERCVVDSKVWNTAIDFVANQSSKLKLIRDKEYYERSRELREEYLKSGHNS